MKFTQIATGQVRTQIFRRVTVITAGTDVTTPGSGIAADSNIGRKTVSDHEDLLSRCAETGSSQLKNTRIRFAQNFEFFAR